MASLDHCEYEVVKRFWLVKETVSGELTLIVRALDDYGCGF